MDLESLIQSTPSTSRTGSTRWGIARKVREPGGDPIDGAPGAARDESRGERVGDVVVAEERKSPRGQQRLVYPASGGLRRGRTIRRRAPAIENRR